MKGLRALGILGVALGGVAFAAPPGPLDGSNIPSDYDNSVELAVQTNRTGFGDQSYGSGDYSPGSEMDGLLLAQDANYLYVGITGNLERNGHAFVIFIDVDNPFFDGQQELRAEGVGGPPFAVQNASREVVIDTNGTPGDGTDDTWTYGANGTILPCEADFAIAVDVYGGTMSVSEYSLFDPAGGAVGTWDPTPDNPGDLPDANLYATRSFVGQGPINDGNDVLENQQDPDYGPAGFDDTNTSGVTDTDASLANAATTGLEIGIPLSLFQGINNLHIYTVLIDGGGSTGVIVNQMLPPLVDVGTAGPCDPPASLGLRPDLTDTAQYLISCRAVDVSALPAFTGTAEGVIHPADYGVGAPLETQSCPTPYGDQHFDPGIPTYIGGSEIDAMYADNDTEFLYLGITGNLEPNGNQLVIFIDTDQETGDAGTHGVPTIAFGGAVPGMAGDTLPNGPLPDDHAVKYNYAYQLNMGTGAGILYADFFDLVNTSGVYRGRVIQVDNVTSNSLLTEGDNPNGMRMALNNLNEVGVPGCGDGEACDLLTAEQIEALARSATKGFEIAIPLADIGLQDQKFPHRIKVWAFITGGGGYGSNQGLPSLRNVSNTGAQVQNAGDGPNIYTDPFNPDPLRAFEGRAAIYDLVGGPFMFEFSLDIGSDKELSDPNVDGDEAFDPGDVYVWRSAPVVPPGRDGLKDDLFIFGPIGYGDVPPDPPDGFIPPATRVPVPPADPGGPYPNYEPQWFDLDGHDQIDFSLSEFLPFVPPLYRENLPPTTCIFPPLYLTISMDDDQAPGWPAADVPVTAPSPAGMIYGTTPGMDEIQSVVLGPAPFPPYPVAAGPFGIADEVNIHASLAPNPDAGDPDDDDVDSLDIVCSTGQCPYWYFTADHEAPGPDASGAPLDPGDIYEVTPGGPVLVIDDVFQLGIPDDTDVDAFEFVWLPSDVGGPDALAVLFSVDEDDPLTAGDESGGLDPTMIYYSVLTGTYAPLLTHGLGDDVDALTNWHDELGDIEGPMIVGDWESYKPAVGAAPELYIPIAQVGSPTQAPFKGVETRRGLITDLRITFSEPIQLPLVTDVRMCRWSGGSTNPIAVSLDGTGTILTTIWTAVPDAAMVGAADIYTVRVKNIVDLAGNPLTGDNDIEVWQQFGNVQLTPGPTRRSTNNPDISAMNANFVSPTDLARARFDVWNAPVGATGGKVNNSDVSQLSARFSTLNPAAVPPTCP